MGLLYNLTILYYSTPPYSDILLWPFKTVSLLGHTAPFVYDHHHLCHCKDSMQKRKDTVIISLMKCAEVEKCICAEIPADRFTNAF